jgi:hypothetical protein
MISGQFVEVCCFQVEICCLLRNLFVSLIRVIKVLPSGVHEGGKALVLWCPASQSLHGALIAAALSCTRRERKRERSETMPLFLTHSDYFAPSCSICLHAQRTKVLTYRTTHSRSALKCWKRVIRQIPFLCFVRYIYPRNMLASTKEESERRKHAVRFHALIQQLRYKVPVSGWEILDM